MSISQKVRHRVHAKRPLQLFSFDQMVHKDENHSAIAKELSRLYSNGVINRLKPGVYYKPKESRFGNLKPSENDILKYLLFEKGKRIGYVSGMRLYNGLGLTSQVSGVIEVASNESKRSFVLAGLRIRYIKAYGRIDKDDLLLMQLLDVIKDLNRIPDARINESLHLVSQKVVQLSLEKQRELVKVAAKYPARVKALVGAMMAKIWERKPLEKELLVNLRKEIVNTSRFQFPIASSILHNTSKWNIYEPA